MPKSSPKSQESVFAIFFAAISIAYSAYFAFSYAYQLPLDVHSFRQTQTALTAYWFIQGGFKLAYETPVVGPEWSIPFEFPIYQFLVATASKLLGAPLDFVGRIISYIFLVLCLIPARSITRSLQLPASVFYIFAAVLFSTPVYVYWGRTFMIETTALFFAVAAIKYFIEILIDRFSYRSVGLYFVFITLSILQKATTGLPVLAILSLLFVVADVRKSGSLTRFVFSNRLFLGVIYFAIPLAIGIVWTLYTDHIKSLNQMGVQLTSSALSPWNWGSIEQRFSSDLYVKVLWNRILLTNLAGIFGAALLLLALFSKLGHGRKLIVVTSILLGVLPLFLFTNLHIVHDYYQSANLIFLVYAVAVALGGILVPALGAKVLVPSLVLILTSNYIALAGGYLPRAKTVFTKGNSRVYAIGEILKRELPQEGQFVAFGNNWSSTLAYIAQRKSFTVPPWFKRYQEITTHPENFVDNDHLDAVVSCPAKKPTIADIIDWTSNNRDWKVGEVHGCYVTIPQKSLNIANPVQVQCRGNIDRAEVEEREGVKIVSFAGWTTMSGSGNIVPDHVFVTLSKPGLNNVYLEALKVPRLDVNARLAISGEFDVGYSRIIPADLPSGQYTVGITQSKGERLEMCQFQKKLVLPGSE